MSMYKVYYDDLEVFLEASYNQCDQWIKLLENCENSIKDFRRSESFKGQSAYKIKKYYKEVHLTLINYLKLIAGQYKTIIGAYVADYYSLDAGDGSKRGQRYTTMASDELKKGGRIDKRLTELKTKARDIRKEILGIDREIDSLVSETIPDTVTVSTYLDKAIKMATDTDSLISYYEYIHKNDFKDLDELIQSSRRILNAYSNQGRTLAVSYQPGDVFTCYDVQQTLISCKNCVASIEAFEKSDVGKRAADIAYGRKVRIHEEEKESRQWAKWVSAGVKVAGTAAIIVGAASGVGLVGVAVIGAVSGTISGATSCLTDEYIETGDATKDLDSFEFVKDMAVGGIAGAFAGYAAGAAVSPSVTMTTFDKIVGGVTEASTASAVSFAVDGSAALYYSISGDTDKLQEAADRFNEDVKDAPVDILKKGFSEAVSGEFDEAYEHGLITSKWADSKSIIKQNVAKGGKKFVKKASTESMDGLVETVSNVVQGKYVVKKSDTSGGSLQTSLTSGADKNVEYVWNENALTKDLEDKYSTVIGKSATSFTSGFLFSVVDSKIENIKATDKKNGVGEIGRVTITGESANRVFKAPDATSVSKVLKGTISSAVDKVEEAVVTREVKNAVSGENIHLTPEEIWDDALGQGRVILEKGADESAKKFTTYNDAAESAKIEREARKKEAEANKLRGSRHYQ